MLAANLFFTRIMKLPRDQRALENFIPPFLTFLEQGGDPNTATSPFGDKLVHVCAFFAQPTWLEFAIKTLSEKNIQLDLTPGDDKIGHTPLHLACSLGSIDMVQILLASGQYPDVNTPDRAGMTPAHFAAGSFNAQGGKAILDLLVHSGADLTIADNNGLTPSNIPEKALFTYSPLTHQNFMGQNPLHSAPNATAFETALKKSPALFFELMAKPDITGRIPLVYHVYTSNMTVLNFVKPHLPSIVNTADLTGKTPLYFAAFYGTPEANQLLLECGADLLQPAANGKTPMDVARESGRNEIVELYNNLLLREQINAGPALITRYHLAANSQAAASSSALPPVINEEQQSPPRQYRSTQRPD
jgi:ankyrin repeat protein